jgi:hypothetical protein
MQIWPGGCIIDAADTWRLHGLCCGLLLLLLLGLLLLLLPLLLPLLFLRLLLRLCCLTLLLLLLVRFTLQHLGVGYWHKLITVPHNQLGRTEHMLLLLFGLLALLGYCGTLYFALLLPLLLACR